MKSSLPATTLARNAYAAQQVNAAFFEKLRIAADEMKQKHHVDVIDISLLRKEKLEELLIKNTEGDIEAMSVEVIANSVDEVVKFETLTLKAENEELKAECQNHVIQDQKNRENTIKSAVARFREKLGPRKWIIIFAKYYWVVVAIIFTCSSLGIGQIKVFLGGTGIYVLLTIANKILEKWLSRSSWGDFFVSKAVAWVWNYYSRTIREGLLDFEKELEEDILRACIEEDELLLKYQQYCL